MLLNKTPTILFETIFCFNIDNYIYSQYGSFIGYIYLK